MSDYRIIFCGTAGAGKATAIETVSSTPLAKTNDSANRAPIRRTAAPTVALDHGVLNLGETDRVHLYGTPALQSADFVQDILSEGGLGLVLLIDNSRDAPFVDLDTYLNILGDVSSETAFVIGVTKMDQSESPGLREYGDHLRGFKLHNPVFEVDARKQRDVSILIQTLLYTLDPKVRANC